MRIVRVTVWARELALAQVGVLADALQPDREAGPRHTEERGRHVLLAETEALRGTSAPHQTLCSRHFRLNVSGCFEVH